METTPLNTDAIEANAFATRGKDIFDPRGNRFIPVGMNCLAKPLGASGSGWYETNLTYANGYSSVYSSMGTVLADEWKYNPLIPTKYVEARELETGTYDFQIAGNSGVPSDIGTVVLCVTATAIQDTEMIFFPTGTDCPTIPNFTVQTAKPITRTVIVAVNEEGSFSLCNTAGETTIDIDVMGWSPVNYGMIPLAPARLLDTRNAGSTVDNEFAGTGKYQPDETRSFTALGRGQLPNIDVDSIVLNVTTYTPSVNTSLSIWASGDEEPDTLEFSAMVDQTTSNTLIVKPGQNREISIRNTYGYVDLTVDVVGYFRASDSGYTSISPVRFMDTRSGFDTSDFYFGGTGQFSAEESRSLQIGGRLGLPYGVKAVTANVTVLNQSNGGHLTVWGDGTRPDTKVISWNDTGSISNLVVIPVDVFGNTYIYASSGTDVIVDVVGWLPTGQVGWGCNFIRVNALDPGSDQTSTDVIQGIYALADEYIEKNVVVCLTNGSYLADHTNPKNIYGQPSYEELYEDDHFVALFEGWINRYKNTPYAWLNPLSEPWRGENLSGWAATGTALYNKARQLGWTGIFVWDLPSWGHGLDLVASSTICEDFLANKENIVLGWHVYNFGTYTDKTLWIQKANEKGIPVIVTEVGSRVYYSPDEILEKIKEEDSVQWCSDSAIPYGTGFVAWAGTGNISNTYVLAGDIGTPFYSVKNALSEDIKAVPPLSLLGHTLRKVAYDYRINNPVYI